MTEDTLVRVVTIITLGVVLLAAVIGMTVTAVMTNRNMLRSESYTFGAALVLGVLGGFNWSALRRRRHWHVKVDHNGEDDDG